jgi:hypothetical protein
MLNVFNIERILHLILNDANYLDYKMHAINLFMT